MIICPDRLQTIMPEPTKRARLEKCLTPMVCADGHKGVCPLVGSATEVRVILLHVRCYGAKE